VAGAGAGLPRLELLKLAIIGRFYVYWLLATALLIAALALAIYLYELYYIYNGVLRAYLPASIYLQQWRAVKSQLPSAITCMMEARAVEAVDEANITIYREGAEALLAAVEELKNETLLKRLNATAYFVGDQFYYNITLGKDRVSGAITWLKPSAMIQAIKSISGATIEADGLGGIEEALAAMVPSGFRLEGYLAGALQRERGHIYAGVLSGVLTLTEEEKMRCLGFYLNETFIPSITAYVSLPYNSSYVFVEIPINIAH
jgi:hypothetical protein